MKNEKNATFFTQDEKRKSGERRDKAQIKQTNVVAEVKISFQPAVNGYTLAGQTIYHTNYLCGFLPKHIRSMQMQSLLLYSYSGQVEYIL